MKTKTDGNAMAGRIRKTVAITIHVDIELDHDSELDDVVNECEYSVEVDPFIGKVIDTELVEWELV